MGEGDRRGASPRRPSAMVRDVFARPGRRDGQPRASPRCPPPAPARRRTRARPGEQRLDGGRDAGRASPPRPTGARTVAAPVDAQLGELLDDLQTDRALAGDDARVVGRRDERPGPRCRPARARARRAPRCAGPTKTISAPSARTPATLTAGALPGMTTTARMPSRRAARATAWAWLPLECVDDAARPARRAKLRERVVGAADLERAGGLEALRLEPGAVRPAAAAASAAAIAARCASAAARMSSSVTNCWPAPLPRGLSRRFTPLYCRGRDKSERRVPRRLSLAESARARRRPSKTDFLRPTYGFDDVSLAPGTETVDPADVDYHRRFAGFQLAHPDPRVGDGRGRRRPLSRRAGARSAASPCSTSRASRRATRTRPTALERIATAADGEVQRPPGRGLRAARSRGAGRPAHSRDPRGRLAGGRGRDARRGAPAGPVLRRARRGPVPRPVAGLVARATSRPATSRWRWPSSRAACPSRSRSATRPRTRRRSS